MSINPASSTGTIAAPAGVVASRPVDDRYRVSRGTDLLDRGFSNLFLGGVAAATLGGAGGAGVAMLTGSGRRGLAAGAAIGAVMLSAGLVGALRSSGTRHEADPESVALAWLPAGGTPDGPSVTRAITYPQTLASLHVDAGTGASKVRRAQMAVAMRPGEAKAFDLQADAIAHARRAPGDQAVVRQDGGSPGREQWLVAELDVLGKSGQDRPQHGYYSSYDRPELLVAPGAAPAPGLRVPVGEWLRSTPYGIDAVASHVSRTEMPLLELGGRELVPARSRYPHSLTMPETYLVGRPD